MIASIRVWGKHLMSYRDPIPFKTVLRHAELMLQRWILVEYKVRKKLTLNFLWQRPALVVAASSYIPRALSSAATVVFVLLLHFQLLKSLLGCDCSFHLKRFGDDLLHVVYATGLFRINCFYRDFRQASLNSQSRLKWSSKTHLWGNQLGRMANAQLVKRISQLMWWATEDVVQGLPSILVRFYSANL